MTQTATWMRTNPITSTEHFNAQPCWSPDSTTVAFCSNRGGLAKIWYVGVDGRRLRVLPGQPPGLACGWPAWSAKSQRIVVRCAPKELDGHDPLLFVCRPDGGKWHQLPYRYSEASNLAWSPDGSRIVYVKALTERGVALYIASTERNEEYQVYPKIGGSKHVWDPAW
jgi:Tol biopolymer transport system component